MLRLGYIGSAPYVRKFQEHAAAGGVIDGAVVDGVAVHRGGHAEVVPVGGKALSFAGWISTTAGNKLLALAHHSVEELLQSAERADFKPVDLGIQFRGPPASSLT